MTIKEERITFVIRKLETAIVSEMSKETFVKNVWRIIMTFLPAKLVIVIRKEVKIRPVTLIVEIVIVCQMFVVQNVINVAVITFRIHFQIAKVFKFPQLKESLLIINFRM